MFAISGFAFSQNIVNRVVEYKPAPGQHINIESVGTPQAAENMPSEISNIVSLGSFGGYIILGFEEACVNDPDNPYGIDFTIFGNAFSGSSEPGVVWVMKDENKNGEPDDTWYEIKGSQHFQSETIENYKVTYFKTDTRDIFWKDNLGESGTLYANSYNTQEYYPGTEYFSDYPQDSVAFNGTLLAPAIDSSNSQQLVLEVLDFGYADSHARKQGVELAIPDNPYTTDIEGAGGDPIDISWAIDSEGNYMNLDSIHFIKIATGNLANIGWLGEISTDVAYVVDVEANPDLTGEDELLVVYHHKSKLLVGESVQLEANYFQNGKLAESDISFSSQNSTVASVSSSGIVKAESSGEAEITITANDKTKTTLVTVVSPDSIQIVSDFSSVYVGDTILLEANVYDNNGDNLYVGVQYSLETQGLGKIIEIEGKSYFVAAEAGDATLSFSVEEFLEQKVNFRIWSADDVINVYFTLKTEDENLLPLQKIEVGLSDLNTYTENHQNDYSGVERPVLAHALVAGLQKAEAGFVFRDDESSGGKLYLYEVENEGDYTHGWGGETSPEAYAKAWISRVNSSQYLNSFNEIEIADGDTIALYFVSSILNSWTFTRILADRDSAVVDDYVEITLEQTDCTFSDGEITESVLQPIQNQEIVAETTYYSNSDGKAAVLIENAPPLVISSGKDAVLIQNKTITSSPYITDLEIQVYPNPVENELIVCGSDLTDKQMYIFDLNGKEIWSESVFSSSENIDVQMFNPGIYVLKIVGDSGAKTFKFVKK